ncbi:MAG TPA: hypothetical protein VH597_12990 [Verrucomicrobiae bacterium]|jgi:hypothetical protein|nr:hypothetical protein [Verrucomicrobiae bacterium]
MDQIDNTKKTTKLAWPGRAAALRRLALIAAVLFPCTWIVTALLIRDWNLLGDRNAEAFRHLREAATVFVAVVCIVFLLSMLPTVQRLFRCLFNRRVVRRTLIALAWMVTAVALFYGEQNWHGRRAWNKYSEALAQQGEELDFKAFIPRAVPEAENFAAAPEIQSWFIRHTNKDGSGIEYHWNTDIYAQAKIKQSSEPDRMPHRMTDLVAWQRAFEAIAAGRTSELREDFNSDQFDWESRTKAAPAILNALKPMDERFDELRAAASRPQSRYPVVYNLENPWGILLPHLSDIRSVCVRLQLRACAELAAGKTDQALGDVKLILRMSDSLNEEPFLISYLVRIQAFHIATQSIWEGLAERRWSDAQLKELQGLLEQYDFIADMKRPLDGERDAGILTADLLGRGKYRLNDLTSDSDSSGSEFMGLMPRGWYDLEKLNYCRLFDLQLKGAFQTNDKRVFPHQVEANSTALQQALSRANRFTRHQLLAALLLPSLGNVPPKSALAQTVAEEALIACGLERYRLAHGQFPDALDALSPDFISRLPHDVISGAAYKYRRIGGQFVLYSVGWNETDDGGQVTTKGTSGVPLTGDWVWQYPMP